MTAETARTDAARQSRIWEGEAGNRLHLAKWIVWPPVLFTVLFFVAPLVVMACVSLWTRKHGALIPEWTLVNYEKFFSKGYLRAALFNSFEVTLLTTMVSVLLAYPLAYVLAFKVSVRWQRLLLLFAVLPFWTSYVVRSYSWLLVISDHGIVNDALIGAGVLSDPIKIAYSRAATVLGFVHFFTMLLTLTIYSNLIQINPSHLKAAQDLGASNAKVLWHVTLPLSLPGIAVGAFLTFVITIGDYITPQILGGNTEVLMPQAIILQISRTANLPMASMMAILLMTCVLLVYFAIQRYLKMEPAVMSKWRSQAPVGIYLLVMLTFIYLPVVILVLFSFQHGVLPVPPFEGPSLEWYRKAFSNDRLMDALLNSVIIALSSSLAATVLGFLAAYGMFRHAPIGAGAVRFLLMAPMTVSYLIIGLGLLIVFNFAGIGKSLLSVGIAHCVINLPICYAIIYSQFGGQLRNIDNAAHDLGASDIQTMIYVIIPVMAPPMLASFLISATLSWDEFIIAFLLSSFDVTLPVMIFEMLRAGLTPEVNAAGTIVFAISVGLAFLAAVAILLRPEKKP